MARAKEEEEYDDEYEDDEYDDEEPPKKHRLLKILLILLLLIVLVIGGFALGIYLRIFDTQAANEKLGLYNLPIIGQYFVKPAPTEEDMQNTPAEDVKPDPEADKKDQKDSKKVQLSKKEIEKQMKDREAAERKRVSKLARLYNWMMTPVSPSSSAWKKARRPRSSPSSMRQRRRALRRSCTKASRRR